MGFYEQISKYYEYIFPAGRDQLDFIIKTAGAPPKKILDVACGTGGYSAELAKAGYNVAAADIDRSMVEMARDRMKQEGLQADVLICDMTDIGRALEINFDCIFCIGNSIVHLGSIEAITDTLSQMRSRLVNGGSVILQIINYDRILKYGITSLPAIKDESIGLEFIRNYEYDKAAGMIRFVTVLTVAGEHGEERYENSIELLPLQSSDLRIAMINAGFSDIEFFGDFKGSGYDDASFMLVARGR